MSEVTRAVELTSTVMNVMSAKEGGHVSSKERRCTDRGRQIAAGSGGSLWCPRQASGATTSDGIAVRVHYRLGELLGAGGLGEVFRAARFGERGFERTVALKRIRPELAQHEHIVQMFIREALVLCRLMHPNIVSAQGFERDGNGELFLVMEYVDGVDLDKLLESGALPHAVVIFIVAEILSGLEHAHHLPPDQDALGVVHRDISPHNVLLSWEGAVKLADFGLAKLRRARFASASSLELAGKVAFMSPEQAAGQPLDDRSDLFSVGVMLWEMLTGERLFARDDEEAIETKWRVLTDWIVRPGVHRPIAPDLEAVVMRLLDRDVGQRFQSAAAARDALMRCEDASKLARFELERVLARRFPEALARRAAPSTSTFALDQGRCRASAPRRAARRWWTVLLVVASLLGAVGIGALVGVVSTRMLAADRSSRMQPPSTCSKGER
jgi:serine/threonine-protein kinase